MTKDELGKLNRGDIVRHTNGNAYIIISNHSGNVLAIREITVSWGVEWTLVKRHDWAADSAVKSS